MLLGRVGVLCGRIDGGRSSASVCSGRGRHGAGRCVGKRLGALVGRAVGTGCGRRGRKRQSARAWARSEGAVGGHRPGLARRQRMTAAGLLVGAGGERRLVLR